MQSIECQLIATYSIAFVNLAVGENTEALKILEVALKKALLFFVSVVPIAKRSTNTKRATSIDLRVRAVDELVDRINEAKQIMVKENGYLQRNLDNATVLVFMNICLMVIVWIYSGDNRNWDRALSVLTSLKTLSHIIQISSSATPVANTKGQMQESIAKSISSDNYLLRYSTLSDRFNLLDGHLVYYLSSIVHLLLGKHKESSRELDRCLVISPLFQPALFLKGMQTSL